MTYDTVIQGDCLEVLKTIESGIVDCCVTSPPYYALRDYGTGVWVGGDENCDHSEAVYSRPNLRPRKQTTSVGTLIEKTVKVCPRCGAVKEDSQIGLEDTPQEYIDKLVQVFREVKRVLKDDGTLWLNIGDSYWGSGSRGFDFTGRRNGDLQEKSQGTVDLHNLPKLVGNTGEYKNKDLIGIPWALAFALRADGWYLRQDIIWHKPNPLKMHILPHSQKN